MSYQVVLLSVVAASSMRNYDNSRQPVFVQTPAAPGVGSARPEQRIGQYSAVRGRGRYHLDVGYSRHSRRSFRRHRGRYQFAIARERAAGPEQVARGSLPLDAAIVRSGGRPSPWSDAGLGAGRNGYNIAAV